MLRRRSSGRALGALVAAALVAVPGVAPAASSAPPYAHATQVSSASPDALGNGAARASSDASRTTGTLMVDTSAEQRGPLFAGAEALGTGIASSRADAAAAVHHAFPVSAGGTYRATASFDGVAWHTAAGSTYEDTALVGAFSRVSVTVTAAFLCEASCSGAAAKRTDTTIRVLECRPVMPECANGAPAFTLSVEVEAPLGESGSVHVQVGMQAFSVTRGASTGPYAMAEARGSATVSAIDVSAV